MSKCCGYEVHPAAELFPMLPDAELKELADDIKKNGLIHHIILHDKKVLDGRNRLVACEIANAVPYFKNYHGQHSPTEFVLATNLKRRQLTKSQQAAIAVESLPLLKQEAKERQLATQNNTAGRAVSAKMREQAHGKATERAAAATGVSPRYVEQAERIKRESPETFQQVLNGKTTVSAAAKEFGRGHEPRPEPDSLSILKSVWKKCNKQQQNAFLNWARKNR